MLFCINYTIVSLYYILADKQLVDRTIQVSDTLLLSETIRGGVAHSLVYPRFHVAVGIGDG